MNMVDIHYYDAKRRKTNDPHAVKGIAVRCQCDPPQYLWTWVAEHRDDLAMIRTWNKDMSAPTIDGSLDSTNCPCHFKIEDGQYA